MNIWELEMLLLIIYFFQVFKITYYTETTVSLQIYSKCMTSDYTKKIAGSLKAQE